MKMFTLGLLTLGLASCAGLEGLSVTFKLPLPEKFGGGSIPITVEK